ncbi:DUF1064 domain-containing protein [[Leptolyngbya] sp. PCC 7376]|uniref:DUF1064 domain-containing protein n=1 Tax=[Leptolyngbya] sp. PCC 7376 TaxID=111781 RepID=UPI0005A14B49|nr:DUF1064 domain-containing protein [[Leptolyngbya] sp. PCC 7376]
MNKKNTELTTHEKPHQDKLPEWIRFDSKLEANTYQALPKQGLMLQFPITLKAGLNSPKIDYVADFLIAIPNKQIVIESKGKLTPEARLKLNLLDAVHPKLFANLLIVTKSQRDIQKLPKWLQGKACTLTRLPKVISTFLEQ